MKDGKERRKDKTLVTMNLFGGSNFDCDFFFEKVTSRVSSRSDGRCASSLDDGVFSSDSINIF
jgi:hypothetical protein